jgi:hypothetical protein
VALLGGAVERLNGHQFDLDKGPNPHKNAISKELGDLAAALKLGSGNSPKELRWPLAGSYTFDWSVADAKSIGYNTFGIDLFFENEPDYRMVVNCVVELRATDTPGQPLSSSSSYLATSSSG